jgi:hypothetical protein
MLSLRDANNLPYSKETINAIDWVKIHESDASGLNISKVLSRSPEILNGII